MKSRSKAELLVARIRMVVRTTILVIKAPNLALL
jgi:hypothetical protein